MQKWLKLSTTEQIIIFQVKSDRVLDVSFDAAPGNTRLEIIERWNMHQICCGPDSEQCMNNTGAMKWMGKAFKATVVL